MRISSNTQLNGLNNTLKSAQNTNKPNDHPLGQNKNNNYTNPVQVNISSISLAKSAQIDSNNSITNETLINSRNGWDGWENKSAKAKEIRNEYYAKEVAIDKKFDNPARHIKDKYYNTSSSYYIEGLTENERLAAYNNESRYLEYGNKAPISYGDPVILKEIGYMNGLVDDALERQFNREKVNEQFRQLLDKYNITIPQDTKLSFTIDPYTYKAKVTGTDNSALISSIESAINTAENSKHLFLHIDNSEWEHNSQITSEKYKKKSLYDDIKDHTGYKLDELEIINGKFVTDDGTDIFGILKKSVKEDTSIPEFFKSYIYADIYEKLDNLAKVGFDGTPDLVLSIDYENGSFYDVGQSKNFGTGQTQWIDAFEEKYSAESYKSGFRPHSPSSSGGNSAEKFDKIGIIKEALQEMLALKDHDKFKIDIDDIGTLDKNELIMKYLFKSWQESGEIDLDSFLEELEKEEIFLDHNINSSYETSQKGNIEIGKTDWINKSPILNQSIDIYV
jgi:hypothetical protein